MVIGAADRSGMRCVGNSSNDSSPAAWPVTTPVTAVPAPMRGPATASAFCSRERPRCAPHNGHHGIGQDPHPTFAPDLPTDQAVLTRLPRLLGINCPWQSSVYRVQLFV